MVERTKSRMASRLTRCSPQSRSSHWADTHATSRVPAALAGALTDSGRDPENVFFGHVGDGARTLRVLREDHLIGGVSLHVDNGDLVAVGSGQVCEVLELLQLRVGRVEEHVTALLEARPQGGLEDAEIVPSVSPQTDLPGTPSQSGMGMANTSRIPSRETTWPRAW